LLNVIGSRLFGADPRAISRRFHRGLAEGTAAAVFQIAERYSTLAVALSGGVFQNALFTTDLTEILEKHSLRVLLNRAAPTNEAGISLGQAALAAFSLSGII